MTGTLTVGTIASGIGGWDIGLERAGMRVAWQCDIDPFARDILSKRWNNTTIYNDAKKTNWSTAPRVDVIAAGYPCQPFSLAGKRGGDRDPRNIWPAVARAIRQVRPRVVCLENVRGHLSLGFGRVLGSLAKLGYDAQWDVLRAADFGAPHQRARVWIVAWDAVDADRRGLRIEPFAVAGGSDAARVAAARTAEHASYADGERWHGGSGGGVDAAGRVEPQNSGHVADAARDGSSAASEGAAGAACRIRKSGIAADADRAGFEECELARVAGDARQPAGAPAAHAVDGRIAPAPGQCSERWRGWHEGSGPPVSPVRRMDDGISTRLDRHRLKALGNALVPDIAEFIGRNLFEQLHPLNRQNDT